MTRINETCPSYLIFNIRRKYRPVRVRVASARL
jgi:hypothetical protein